MAIVIKGISKGPIEGYETQLLLRGDGIVMEKVNGVYQTLGAEWKEIPDEHGRLIDADWLRKNTLYVEDEGYDQSEIDEAPTIVEANV